MLGFRQNPSKPNGTNALVNVQLGRVTGEIDLGALQERLKQLESENAQLRLQVQVLRELLLDE